MLFRNWEIKIVTGFKFVFWIGSRQAIRAIVIHCKVQEKTIPTKLFIYLLVVNFIRAFWMMFQIFEFLIRCCNVWILRVLAYRCETTSILRARNFPMFSGNISCEYHVGWEAQKGIVPYTLCIHVFMKLGARYGFSMFSVKEYIDYILSDVYTYFKSLFNLMKWLSLR